jgi:hypothetical protein
MSDGNRSGQGLSQTALANAVGVPRAASTPCTTSAHHH